VTNACNGNGIWTSSTSSNNVRNHVDDYCPERDTCMYWHPQNCTVKAWSWTDWEIGAYLRLLEFNCTVCCNIAHCLVAI
jgi:hypothetical protein